MKKDGDVLLDAVTELEDHGWTQGRLLRADRGSMCAVGAINKTIFGNVDPSIRPWDVRKAMQRKRILSALAEKIDEVEAPYNNPYEFFYETCSGSANMNKVMGYNDMGIHEFDKLKALFVETAVTVGISPERQRR